MASCAAKLHSSCTVVRPKIHRLRRGDSLAMKGSWEESLTNYESMRTAKFARNPRWGNTASLMKWTSAADHVFGYCWVAKAAGCNWIQEGIGSRTAFMYSLPSYHVTHVYCTSSPKKHRWARLETSLQHPEHSNQNQQTSLTLVFVSCLYHGPLFWLFPSLFYTRELFNLRENRYYF